MASLATSNQDAWYLSLLGIAEYFRTSSPPNIRHCIQCLEAVFNFKPPTRVEARTHLQLGTILLIHTKNTDLARIHLEQAWNLSQSIGNFDDVKFESASILAKLYYEEQHQSNLSKPILRKAIELSNGNVYWHCRLIFQLSQIHASEKDYSSACSLLGFGVDYAEYSMAHYTRVLFLLSKGMLLLISKRFQEVHPLLQQASLLVEAWQGNQHQKEYLKVFFLVLQVCHYLMAGQIKSVKPSLKQLQQSIQIITQPSWPSDEDLVAENIGDMFMWMPKEHLCVLVYLITTMHSMQGGYLDKAQKYTDKALIQIDKLRILEQQPILNTFQLLLLEQIIMCRLVMGNKALALQEISQAFTLCQQHPKLLTAHKAPLHTLLGLYAMSMNCMEAAEVQFSTALNNSQERELWTFVHLNLAIVYLRTKREAEFQNLIDRINPETLASTSHSLRAAAYYVQGLQSFFQARYNDAKRYLRESLKMANAEDLNRLTSCSLVLLGHIFLSLGNSRESMNMVTPAMQLASKIPDVHVQLWASAVLKDLYRLNCDPARENEANNMHCNFTQMLLKDHFTASQLPEHNLIHWTEGEFPFPLNNMIMPSQHHSLHSSSPSSSSSSNSLSSQLVGSRSNSASLIPSMSPMPSIPSTSAVLPPQAHHSHHNMALTNQQQQHHLPHPQQPIPQHHLSSSNLIHSQSMLPSTSSNLQQQYGHSNMVGLSHNMIGMMGMAGMMNPGPSTNMGQNHNFGLGSSSNMNNPGPSTSSIMQQLAQLPSNIMM